MKKTIRILVIFFGVILTIYGFLATLNILRVYKNSSTANEPNLPLNSRMLVTNLIKPKLGDFICFEYEDEMFGEFIKVNRLVAKANDSVEIKNGILFINGENFDQNIDLVHFYKINKSEFDNLSKDNHINKDLIANKLDENVFIIDLEDSTAKNYNVFNKKLLDTIVDNTIKNMFNENWNKDNFGPLIIPENKLFVLGDNRDNSMDSRYVGLIDDSKVIGVVIKNKAFKF